jgi:1,4-alpha-glucan branching enzyme
MPATVASRTTAAGNVAAARLEISRAEGTYFVLRLHMPGASSVDLMADFTDWQPVPMASVRDDVWEIRHELIPGVYRLNVRIDGGPWLVPNGARSEQDEFGGVVGVVVIR